MMKKAAILILFCTFLISCIQANHSSSGRSSIKFIKEESRTYSGYVKSGKNNDIVGTKPVSDKFAGCFGGANNDSFIMRISDDMDNVQCIEICGGMGFAVAATKGKICTCNYDFQQLLPQIAQYDDDDSSGPNGACNTPCGLWDSFGLGCDQDRCCGGETAWSAYIADDIDSNLQVARRVMTNIAISTKGQFGQTPFCYAFGVDGKHCDEVMGQLSKAYVTVNSVLNSDTTRTCVIRFNPDSSFNESCVNQDADDVTQDRVAFSVQSYSTQLYYGFPTDTQQVSEVFSMNNKETNDKTMTDEYSITVSTTETVSTSSSSTSEVSSSSSISSDTSSCMGSEESFSFEESTTDGVDGGITGIVCDFTFTESQSVSAHEEVCASIASSNEKSLTQSSTYETGYEQSNTTEVTNLYSVTVNVPGGCAAKIAFFESAQPIRQQWSSMYTAAGNVYIYMDGEPSSICDTSEGWCQSFLNSLGATNVMDFARSLMFVAIGKNNYEESQSLFADITLSDGNTGGECKADPNYHEDNYVTDQTSTMELIPEPPAWWSTSTCKNNLRFIHDLSSHEAAQMNCSRNNFDVNDSLCQYHCMTNEEYLHDRIVIPPGAIVTEITLPTGTTSDTNLCDSFTSTSITLDCPCPDYYVRNAYNACELPDNVIVVIQYSDIDDQLCTSGTYTGTYVNALRSGQGTMTCDNGVTYVGAWANDKKNGQGVYNAGAVNNYKVYSGTFKDGAPICSADSVNSQIGYGWNYVYFGCIISHIPSSSVSIKGGFDKNYPMWGDSNDYSINYETCQDLNCGYDYGTNSWYHRTFYMKKNPSDPSESYTWKLYDIHYSSNQVISQVGSSYYDKVPLHINMGSTSNSGYMWSMVNTYTGCDSESNSMTSCCHLIYPYNSNNYVVAPIANIGNIYVDEQLGLRSYANRGNVCFKFYFY